MKELEKLYLRIVQRANINLREIGFDVKPYVWDLIPATQMNKFYAFYGVSPNHPLDIEFKNSGLAGSYFLGKCRSTNSLLYKSDIRGDELKKKDDSFQFEDFKIWITKDEAIEIEDSALVKTLVHNYSHDPETPERFCITNTISTHYANIHGSPIDGCFLGPFATVDFTTVHDSVIGAFSYINAGEIYHMNIEPGTVWVRKTDAFNFLYRYPVDRLNDYIIFMAGNQPQGILIDFVNDRKDAFQRVFDVVNIEQSVDVPDSASVDRYSVIKPKTVIGENVLVCQRAFLQNAWLGKGANAQENCYIVNSHLEGYNVTAHGAKLIETDLGNNVFVGFNSFLRGRPGHRLSIGSGSIVMPHTIIDINEALEIPEEHLMWGLITNQKELMENSISLAAFSKIDGNFIKGDMVFEGNGVDFVNAFKERIHHILDANGAFFDGTDNRGHAQKNQNLSFNTIQPYPSGDMEGLYPTIFIKP